MLNKILRKI